MIYVHVHNLVWSHGRLDLLGDKQELVLDGGDVDLGGGLGGL